MMEYYSSIDFNFSAQLLVKVIFFRSEGGFGHVAALKEGCIIFWWMDSPTSYRL